MARDLDREQQMAQTVSELLVGVLEQVGVNIFLD
jgi:hypothetical protein